MDGIGMNDLIKMRWDYQGEELTKGLRCLMADMKGHIKSRPDFNKLADDLTVWGEDWYYIQRQWMRTIFAVNSEQKGE